MSSFSTPMLGEPRLTKDWTPGLGKPEGCQKALMSVACTLICAGWRSTEVVVVRTAKLFSATATCEAGDSVMFDGVGICRPKLAGSSPLAKPAEATRTVRK